MRGYLLSCLSLLGVVFFSVCLFLSSNLSFFWLYLELSTLSLVPSFFLYRSSLSLDALFNYLIVSSVSSSLIVCGLLSEGLLFLMLLGLLIKFGLFPFFGWIYTILVNSNWGVVWGISTFLKSSFLFFSFLLSGGSSSVVNILCVATLLVLSFLFWFYSYSWFHCWCHMMLSSSAVLVVMAFSASLDTLLWLFFIYILWASLVVFFFSLWGDSFLSGWLGYFFFVFLLVSVPCSASIFYKLVVGFCVFSCASPVLLSWVVYSVSEQLFLVKFLVGSGIPSSLSGLVRLV